MRIEVVFLAGRNRNEKDEKVSPKTDKKQQNAKIAKKSTPFYKNRNCSTMDDDDVAGRNPINNGDLISQPSSVSFPPPPLEQLDRENHPGGGATVPDHRLVSNERNHIVGSPSDGVGVVEETQPQMIGPQPPPPPQHRHSHSQHHGQGQESKQEQQEDTAYQRRQQQQPPPQQPAAQTLKLWNDVAENLAKHQTGEFQKKQMRKNNLFTFEPPPPSLLVWCGHFFVPTLIRDHSILTLLLVFPLSPTIYIIILVIWVKAVDSLESARLYLKEYPALPTPSAAFIGGVDPSVATTANDNNAQSNTNPARLFVDKYMLQIISILLEQSPLRIGQMEKECVEKSLRIAMQIVKDDLDTVNNNYHNENQNGGSGDILPLTNTGLVRNELVGGYQQERDGVVDNGRENINTTARVGVNNDDSNSSTFIPTSISSLPCPTVITLSHIFHKKKVYYKPQTRQWHNGPSVGGLPEVRTHMISVFRRIHGLTALGTYMEMRVGCVDSFPDMDWCREILGAVLDSLPAGSDYGMVMVGGGRDGNNVNSSNASSLAALGRGGGQGENPTPADLQLSKRRHNLSESKVVTSAIMKHVLLLDEITLKKMDTHTIQGLRRQLHTIYSRICDADGTTFCPSANSNNVVGGAGEEGGPSLLSDAGVVGGPKAMHEFFTFWRALTLKLITSQSLPLKLFGWDEIGFLIFESEKLAPPPRAYRVIGAGTPFVNGLYEFDKKRVGMNGYVKSGVELQYHRIIPLHCDGVVEDCSNGGDDPVSVPPSNIDGAGKTMTLFRCTMRSSHKWWFLSEADEDQPGTDKDIDYYQHKSKKEEESLPSHSGWSTCRAGTDPPPTLEAVGKLVPPSEECNTLERLLAKWAIENGVIELVLGDGIHREVVSRSAGLIKFLAGMCGDNGGQDVVSSTTKSNDGDSMSRHCLKASHLLLAWKTCTNKADAAVSAQIYHLLVSILPSLPSSLAIPLIDAAFDSLDQKGLTPSTSGGVEKQYDRFLEVSEFCGAIAEKMLADTARDRENDTNKQDPSNASEAEDPVREAILNLQWAVLAHKDVLTHKSYESIKKFVSSEICKQDVITEKLRHTFLQHACYEIKKNGICTDPNALDETHALHMVQLAQFLLKGYGQDGMEAIICPSSKKLDQHFPTLIFRDLMSYMKRRSRVGCAVTPLRKVRGSRFVLFFNSTYLCTSNSVPFLAL